jgi:regulatory protein YycH of two-component signal transduction system YycFG
MSNVMSWTVFQLMTDTAVLEQARHTNEDVKAIMLQLERKLDAIIARESANA